MRIRKIKQETGCNCLSVVPRAVIKVAEASVFLCVLGRQVILEAEEEVSEGFFGFKIEVAVA